MNTCYLRSSVAFWIIALMIESGCMTYAQVETDENSLSEVCMPRAMVSCQDSTLQQCYSDHASCLERHGWCEKYKELVCTKPPYVWVNSSDMTRPPMSWFYSDCARTKAGCLTK